MEPAAAGDAMELGAASSGIGANSNSLVAKTWSLACNYNSLAWTKRRLDAQTERRIDHPDGTDAGG
jgi:hypothetical protein